MTASRPRALARLYGQYDLLVTEPVSYVRGFLRTRLSGGRFGRLPSIEGPVEFRIRGAATVGDYFKARGTTWRARVTVGRDGLLQVGDNFRMNDGASVQVWHEVIIGSNVMMAPFSSVLDDHCHLIEPDSTMYERPVVIGDNVWLGKSAVVLPGVSIGSGSVIAANSVVTRDIPPNSLAAGSPAKVTRTLDVPADWTRTHGYDDYRPGGRLVSALKSRMTGRSATSSSRSGYEPAGHDMPSLVPPSSGKSPDLR